MSVRAATAFLADWLDFQAQQTEPLGLSIAIYHKNKLILSKAYGHENTAVRTPMTSESIFNCGSQTKMFTAVAVAILAAAGKLHLQDYACTWLPWLKYHPDTRMRGVTIEQLLTHRSGLVRDGLIHPFWHLEAPFPDTTTLQYIVMATKLTHDNYAQYKYSNVGFALLGQIIQAASRQSYEQFVTQNIIKPLALSAWFKPPHTCRGYTRPINGKRVETPGYIATHAFAATTGLYTTPQAMCRFMAAQFHDPRFIPFQAMLHKPRFHEPTQTAPQAYAAGFMLTSIDNNQFIGHSGGFIGYGSCTFYNPRTNICVAVMSNAKDTPTQLISQGIFSVFHFFEKNPAPPHGKHTIFNARVVNLWTTMQIIATPSRIVAARLGQWLPFIDIDDLTQVAPHTLTIHRTSALNAQNELVKYIFKNDELLYINYAGSILRPEALFRKTLADCSATAGNSATNRISSVAL